MEECYAVAKDRLEDEVLTLWKAAPKDVRLGFVAHPVDDARIVLTQLTEALARANEAEGEMIHRGEVIKRLEAERDELRAERETLLDQDRTNQLQGELTEARAALERVASHGASLDSDILTVQDIARQALKNTEGAPSE